jgi:hypothetical protein
VKPEVITGPIAGDAAYRLRQGTGRLEKIERKAFKFAR